MMVELEEILRLDVKPGEMLVVRVRQEITRPELDELEKALAAAMPEGVRFFVTNADIDLSAVAYPRPGRA